jgi:hypothetical protein
MEDGWLGVNRLIAIVNFEVALHGIVQHHHISLGSVKNHINHMSLIEVAGMYTRSLLLVDGSGELILRCSYEVIVQ